MARIGVPVNPSRNSYFLRTTLAVGVVVALGACSGTKVADAPVASAGASAAAGPRTTYPLTIDNCGRTVTFTQAPRRVVLLNGASVAEVESMIALGVQGAIVANSQTYGVSDDPTMVARIKAIPTGGVKLNKNFEVPREQVLAQSPDLVISTWAGGFDDKIGSITRDELGKTGINSFVTPSNCANGATSPRPEDTQTYAKRSVESSFDLLTQLGLIFDVQGRAAQVVQEARAALAALPSPATERKRVLAAYPSMGSAMGLAVPAVFGGGIFDDIITRAGGVNAFGGLSDQQLGAINVEALAAANVDVLVIGLYQPDDDAEKFAEQLFAQFPQWPASKTKTYTSVSDSFYLGPLNAIAVKRISDGVRAAG
ncbi:ABC transporter iron(III)/siderophore-binding protein [Micromonospora endophytica]|uniref:ABC transporter iron(III)/siderophore-binding protein n=1 Tax=Micromonospora endophytica TaxID=515350 RepID=A0A2W2CGV1_9ACTN|nr:ABC transporter iron(III)/siderophore-binding protein [Micromonospora endophytica]RIW45204.1 ABC transporter iron(III)/siderophore-binding protein [Micromonospora endophytica]